MGREVVEQHDSPGTFEVRPRKDYRGADLIADAVPFGWLWYGAVSAAIDYAKVLQPVT